MLHKIKVLTNVMLGTIICDVGTRYHNCDEGIIICEVNKDIK
jgi:hypothetical protein